MDISNLVVSRIIIHQVYQRDPDGAKIPPLKSHEYTRFDPPALDAFQKRIVDALGEDSKAVEMEIVDHRPDKLPKTVERMALEDDAAFLESSYELAKLLTESQQQRNIPGGILVAFSGTYGPHTNSIVGVIKAEIHSGYQKILSEETNEISLQFVRELLLTPGNRLYKTAAFLERDDVNNDYSDMNEKWSVMVSDYQINRVEGKAAARYFYRDFLGCDYPETSARTTKRFYDATATFIGDLDISESERADLFNALTTFLRVEKSDVVNPLEFGSRHFDAETQDQFHDAIAEAEVPTTAFPRDTAHIANRLKYRKVNFSSSIKITGPSDLFGDYVTIEAIEGRPDENGAPEEWTQVIVKDRIASQE